MKVEPPENHQTVKYQIANSRNFSDNCEELGKLSA